VGDVQIENVMQTKEIQSDPFKKRSPLLSSFFASGPLEEFPVLFCFVLFFFF